MKSSKLPYGTTKVPWVKTKFEIEGLLAEYGALGTQWTTYKGEEVLKFIFETEIRGIRKEIGMEIRPPSLLVQKRVRGRGLVKTRNKDQEYRLMYWWLKSKLEAISYGLVSVENEFLAQVIVALPDGTTTVGEVLSEYIVKDKLEALPAPAPERKAIESEVVTH